MTETKIERRQPFVAFAIKLILLLMLISLLQVFSIVLSSNLLYSEFFSLSESIFHLILLVELVFLVIFSLS